MDSVFAVFVAFAACIVSARDFHVDAKSGDDGNDGLAPTRAWRSIKCASRQKLAAGDRLLLRAGCVWRLDNTFHIRAAGSKDSPVVVGRYGDGPAPELRCSLDGLLLDWRRETNGLWSASCGNIDIGNIVWDDGCGFKKPSLGDVSSEGDFWYDRESGRLFFKYRDDPRVTCRSLEISRRIVIVGIKGASGLVLSGLSLSYSGSHGIKAESVQDVTIRDCTFSWLGGSFLMEPSEKKPCGVRYGNGIEIWTGGMSRNIRVEGCLFSDIYDVAITNQGKLDGELDGMVIFSNSIVRCEQGYEFWFSNPKYKVGSIEIRNNVFDDTGFGWSHAQRPNKIATHILAYDVNCPKGRVVLQGNRFGRTAKCAIWLFGLGAEEWLELGDNEIVDDFGGVFMWRVKGKWLERKLSLPKTMQRKMEEEAT